ncbi:MAG: hypothetical protein KC445_21650, partial [Anaerolineales bacterium]|nr:hypothetical protein [Anaerolineales bacterium]
MGYRFFQQVTNPISKQFDDQTTILKVFVEERGILRCRSGPRKRRSHLRMLTPRLNLELEQLSLPYYSCKIKRAAKRYSAALFESKRFSILTSFHTWRISSYYGLRLVQFPYRGRIAINVDISFKPLSRLNAGNWTNLYLAHKVTN